MEIGRNPRASVLPESLSVFTGCLVWELANHNELISLADSCEQRPSNLHSLAVPRSASQELNVITLAWVGAGIGKLMAGGGGRGGGGAMAMVGKH